MKNCKQSNIPKLRFPEFEGEWEKKKLGEVADIGRGKSKHRPRDADYLFDGKYPFIQTGDIRKAQLYLTEFSQTYSEEGLKQSKLWNENTLCITIAANIAETAILKIKACFPDSVIGLIPKDNKTIVLFVKHLFDKFKVQIQSLSQGAAQDNLNKEKLSNIEFTFPTLPEQTRIAQFFSAIDKKLQSLKKKKELLEQYKKGVMQKLFSQELRFKIPNADGELVEPPEWEEKKLGNVFYSEKGKGISKNKVTANGKYECILYGELYTKYNEIVNEVVSKTNEVEGLKSKIGDLLIPSSTTTTGIDLANVTALNKNNVLLGGDITVLRSNVNINNVFFAYYLSNHKKDEIASYAQGITIVHLYYNHIKNMNIDLPCLAEQTKIANFLSAIDEKINRTENQIQQTIKWKKGLLQKMFI